MTLEVGKSYPTRKAGNVLITEDLGRGRKRFLGILPDGTKVSYFRNGVYSNASKATGGHPYDILLVASDDNKKG